MRAADSTRPPGPLGVALGRAARVSRLLAALLITAVSLRFVIASFQHALGVSGPSLPGTTSSPPVGAEPRPAASLLRPRPSGSNAAPIRSGESRSIHLGISAGPGRSAIYVNGESLGNTPFLGSTSCKTGMPLRIELVPLSGPVLVYERECRGAVIEITGPPP